MSSLKYSFFTEKGFQLIKKYTIPKTSLGLDQYAAYKEYGEDIWKIGYGSKIINNHTLSPTDRASQEEEFAFELRTRDRERKLINKIASSLEQIEQDDYGYCYSCGIEIGLKRLEARPTATHCIDCKTLDEIKEKQLGG